MENQHRKIAGYRELTQEEINLINEIKSIGTMLDKLTIQVMKHVDQQYAIMHDKLSTADNELYKSAAALEIERFEVAEPSDWVIRARNDFQDGLMKLTRAVAQPTTF